jgi:aryl-alcohol dehydrogenase-like predicted oxidoreductase
VRLREYGTTGIKVSELGLGLWSLVTHEWGGDIDRAEEVVRKAFDMGITFFDTADVYGEGKGEEVIAKALGMKRDRIVILTKVGLDFYHKQGNRIGLNYDVEYLEFAVKKSLERLNTDYVDILMLHNPKMRHITDRKVLEFAMSLKKDGIARSVGIALGPTLGWLEEGLKAIEVGYEGLEFIFNVVEQEPGRTFDKYNVGKVVRVPHASDALDEERNPLEVDPKLHRRFKDVNWIRRAMEAVKPIKDLAYRKGLKLYEVALLYALRFNFSSVVPNIADLRDLERFVNALNKELDEEIVNEIEALYERELKELNEESVKETLAYK